MKRPEIPYTVIANEILNLLDSTVLSSESKNSILVDYLERAYCQGFGHGQKSSITGILSDVKNIYNK